MEERLEAETGLSWPEFKALMRRSPLCWPSSSAERARRRHSVTRPAISQHLTILKDAGLLAERREGPRRPYTVRAEGLVGLREFIDRFWSTPLGELKRAAEDEAKDGGA